MIWAGVPSQQAEAADAAYPSKTVLILYSYNQELPFYAQFTAGLKQGMQLENQMNVQFHYEYLDLNVSTDERFSQALFTVLQQKYRFIRPDSIIVHGMPGVEFLLNYGRSLFDETPVTVVVTRKPDLEELQLPANYTVYYPPIDTMSTAQMILRLQPETQSLYVVTGVSTSERLIRQELPGQLAFLTEQLNINFLDGLPTRELLNRIQHLPRGHSAILFVDFTQDLQGKRYIPAQFLQALCNNSPVPVFSSYSTHLGNAAVGGYMLDMNLFGRQIGREICALFQGQKPTGQLIPIDIAHYMADWRELQRWNMKSFHLPDDTTVINQPVSIWQEYKSHIFAVLLVILAQTVLIGRHMNKRRQAEKELARLDQLHLVGEMAAGIGHEIRNPLTTVRGYLQLLATKKKLPSDETLQLMISELDRANSIITEFLKLAKNKVIQRSLCSINEVVENLLPMLQAEASLRGHELVYLPADTPDVLIDEKEIRQVILNLAINGLDAMKQHGRLEIRTSVVQQFILLSIQDYGTGIPAEIANKIGTPFFTTKEKGTGLGLSICFAIAERHGGKLDFVSDYSGTTFYFYLPIVARRVD